MANDKNKIKKPLVFNLKTARQVYDKIVPAGCFTTSRDEGAVIAIKAMLKIFKIKSPFKSQLRTAIKKIELNITKKDKSIPNEDRDKLSRKYDYDVPIFPRVDEIDKKVENTYLKMKKMKKELDELKEMAGFFNIKLPRDKE